MAAMVLWKIVFLHARHISVRSSRHLYTFEMMLARKGEDREKRLKIASSGLCGLRQPLLRTLLVVVETAKAHETSARRMQGRLEYILKINYSEQVIQSYEMLCIMLECP